jgi:asparagine synthase (glutamine-hydrolysing)
VCGLIALLRLGERPLPDRACVTRMAASIAHRGPDGWGLYTDDWIQLAALRLTVVDPEGGRQPVRGCRPGLVAATNGELYAHAALRQALEAEGHRIPDRCDTSLVPHLYEVAGDALVERLRGMFALAVWDADARRLLLARDRLGIKPLYLARTPELLIVASEVKAILASGLVPAAIEPEALGELFTLGYPCPPATLFRGITELEPAHRLVARGGGAVGPPERYWRAPFVPRAERGRGPDLEAGAAQLRSVLTEAVEQHLVADVPVAATVSGGLDSSTIAALAARVTGRGPATFSLGFPGEAIDESAHAAAVSAALGGPAHRIALDRRAAARLPEMLWHTELPLLMPGAIGGLELSEAQRAAGFRVALTGDGADELLGGYDVFRLARLRRALDASPLAPLQPGLLRLAAGLLGQPSGLAALLARPARDAARLAARSGGVVLPWADQMRLLDVDRAALLAPSGARPPDGDTPPERLLARLRPDLATLEPLDAQLAIELETRLPAWILVISDRSAMARGIEARVPFLDDRVVEAALALPASIKMRGLEEKAVLRRAARGLLPPAVRRRRKQPFTAPIAPWFFAPGAPGFVDELLSPRALADAGLFEPSVVARLRDELDRAPAHSAARLQRELVLMLVLSTQLVERLFVRGLDRPTPRFALGPPRSLESSGSPSPS